MSRQLDVEREQRETARRDQLVKALEYGIVGALQTQGMELLGLSIRYDEYACSMTLRGEINGQRRVAFLNADTLMNCILSAYTMASHGRLKWGRDKYHPDED